MKREYERRRSEKMLESTSNEECERRKEGREDA
jgi:hypothetical protein